MTDNSNNRLHEVFFYGLYMDENILKDKGVKPKNQRVAYAKDYALRVGNLATLLRVKDEKAYGLVYSLTYEEIDKLYKDSGLTQYVAEALQVCFKDGKEAAVLCCNLLNPPKDEESNPQYLEKLKLCMQRYDLPFNEVKS